MNPTARALTATVLTLTCASCMPSFTRATSIKDPTALSGRWQGMCSQETVSGSSSASGSGDSSNFNVSFAASAATSSVSVNARMELQVQGDGTVRAFFDAALPANPLLPLTMNGSIEGGFLRLRSFNDTQANGLNLEINSALTEMRGTYPNIGCPVLKFKR